MATSFWVVSQNKYLEEIPMGKVMSVGREFVERHFNVVDNRVSKHQLDLQLCKIETGNLLLLTNVSVQKCEYI